MRIWRYVLAVVLLGVLILAVYVVHLDRIVTTQFEGRRWTLPAQVYAAPQELYVGEPLAAADLEHELQRLQYRRADPADRPGSYSRQGDRFQINLRPARFADEVRPATLLRIQSNDATITAMTDGGGKDVAIARLEPLLIGSIFPIHGEDRIVVTPQQVPPMLPAALKAVEDRNFDTHHGVDPLGVLRAIWVDARSGQLEQGGSTLTQQLVKNYFLTSRRTAGRKLQEALMAVLLEMHFSKTDIMTAYINEIQLGQDGDRAIRGFGLASQFYFGKPLAELDVAQVATLVAVARGPSYYDPRRHPDRALKRRNVVLGLMAEQKIIPASLAQQAQERPLGVMGRGSGGYYPAYLDLVRRTLRRDYREQDLTEAGLSIFTNLEPRTQELAEKILDRELTRLDHLHKSKGAPLEGSVVVTAPQSGDVTAVLGGRQAGFDGFNRALDARRPIGSLVKPFVYLAAIETGRYNPASIIEDVPVDIKVPGAPDWQPENFEHDINGPIPMVKGLARSLNLATINLGMDIGLDTVRQSLQRFGIPEDPPRIPSLLLGTFGLTPLDVAQLYTGLANGGFKTNLRAVNAVLSADGKALKSFNLAVTPVAQPDAVFEVQMMMEQVMQRGTGVAAEAILPTGVVVAGKSGTSSDLRDSWFAGFAGNAVAVVWVGYDDDRVTGLTGSTGALNVWDRLLTAIGPTSVSSVMPESLHPVTIDFRTGYAPAPNCSPEPVTVYVPSGFTPPEPPPGCTAFGQAPAAASGAKSGPSLLERAGKLIQSITHGG
ncbi:MAG TPA: penicillin-binding protein 1B [Steroidobacteraceae bacterium]|nr:penicillin-binding protein 1B [Steroidobacteraceae bacterium]